MSSKCQFGIEPRANNGTSGCRFLLARRVVNFPTKQHWRDPPRMGRVADVRVYEPW